MCRQFAKLRGEKERTQEKKYSRNAVSGRTKMAVLFWMAQNGILGNYDLGPWSAQNAFDRSGVMSSGSCPSAKTQLAGPNEQRAKEIKKCAYQYEDIKQLYKCCKKEGTAPREAKNAGDCWQRCCHNWTKRPMWTVYSKNDNGLSEMSE